MAWIMSLQAWLSWKMARDRNKISIKHQTTKLHTCATMRHLRKLTCQAKYHKMSITCSGGGRWGLQGPEPPQLCTRKGRAPPKIVDYDIIYLITCYFKDRIIIMRYTRISLALLTLFTSLAFWLLLAALTVKKVWLHLYTELVQAATIVAAPIRLQHFT